MAFVCLVHFAFCPGMLLLQSAETGLKPPEIFGRITNNQVLQKQLQYILERPILIWLHNVVPDPIPVKKYIF